MFTHVCQNMKNKLEFAQFLAKFGSILVKRLPSLKQNGITWTDAIVKFDQIRQHLKNENVAEVLPIFVVTRGKQIYCIKKSK